MNRRGFLFGLGAAAGVPLTIGAQKAVATHAPEYVTWGDGYWDRDFVTEVSTRVVRWRIWSADERRYFVHGLGASVSRVDVEDENHLSIVRGLNRCLEQLRIKHDWPVSLLMVASQNRNPRYFPGLSPEVRFSERLTGLLCRTL